MLFISTKHNTVLEIHQRGPAGNFTWNILSLPVVTKNHIFFMVKFAKYRIFSIKRRGRLFKTRPHRPGIYSGPGFYLLSAFFSHPFFISSTGGLLN